MIFCGNANKEYFCRTFARMWGVLLICISPDGWEAATSQPFFISIFSKYLLLLRGRFPFRLHCKGKHLFWIAKQNIFFFFYFAKLFLLSLFWYILDGVCLQTFFVGVFCAHIIIIRGRVCVCPRAFFSDGWWQTVQQPGANRAGCGRGGCARPPPRRAYSTTQRTPADTFLLSEAPSFLSVSGLKRSEWHLFFIFLIEK